MKNFLFALTVCVISAIYAESEEEVIAKNGGWCKLKGYGFVAAIDCRQVKSEADFKDGIDSVKSTFKPDIRVVNGKAFSLSNATEQLKNSKANAAVFIIEDKNLPMTLTAYEEKWTFINAAKIKEDSPDAAKFRKRLSLLFMRQCCRILGSDATKTPDCCLYPVFNLKDLDSITSMDVAIGVYIAINESMPCIGVEGIEMGTYRDACELGLSIPPTNDVQRAIAAEVKKSAAAPGK